MELGCGPFQQQEGDNNKTTWNQQGYDNPLAAKNQVIINTLHVARIMGIKKIHVNTDYKSVVDCVQTTNTKAVEELDHTHIGYQISLIKNLSIFENDGMSFIRREMNGHAHRMTQKIIKDKNSNRLFKSNKKTSNVFAKLFR